MGQKKIKDKGTWDISNTEKKRTCDNQNKKTWDTVPMGQCPNVPHCSLLKGVEIAVLNIQYIYMQ